MRSVSQALQDLLPYFTPLPSELTPIADAYGRTLADAIHAVDALPPTDNSSMDGFAVRAHDITEPPVRLQVVADIPAGAHPAVTLQTGQAARIMTGATVPAGADTVVPVEQTDADNQNPHLPETVEIRKSHAAGAYIRQRGEDVLPGAQVFAAGHRLRPQDVGLLAGLGIAHVPVIRRPRVALLSTGDELLPADAPLVPGKIRDMNTYSLRGMLQNLGAEVLSLGIARDTVSDVRQKLQIAVMQNADVIVSSAGVSVGTKDVVKAVLDDMGEIGFWKVNMRPGKPLAFGHVQGIPFFGLPGNPVSSLASFEIFVRPAILSLLGEAHQVPTVDVLAGQDMDSDGRESYIRVTVERHGGQLMATPTGTQSSGVLSSLVMAVGLLIIPAGVRHVRRGDVLQLRPFAGQPILK